MSAKAIYEYQEEITALKQEVARLRNQLDAMAQTYQGRNYYEQENA